MTSTMTPLPSRAVTLLSLLCVVSFFVVSPVASAAAAASAANVALKQQQQQDDTSKSSIRRGHRSLGNRDELADPHGRTGRFSEIFVHIHTDDDENNTEKKQRTPTTTTTLSYRHDRPWVRGVNIGGWLLLERFITPYMFALTDCHVQGDLCWYPGQLSARKSKSSKKNKSTKTVDNDADNNNKNIKMENNGMQQEEDDDDDDEEEYPICNLYTCQPLREPSLFGDFFDYPLDEWTLALAFRNLSFGAGQATTNAASVTNAAASTASTSSTTESAVNTNSDNNNNIDRSVDAANRWINAHLDNFVTLKDLQRLKANGVTHVRVPLPHWILGNVVEPDEPWIVADRWKYFVRLLGWARLVQMEVWPDIHSAPGSQNGFDNSGRSKLAITCKDWSDRPDRVQRSLDILQNITSEIVKTGYHTDVVTGFGILNEPFKDCTRSVYLNFMEQGFQIVKNTLGPNAAVYVSDTFQAPTFNRGHKYGTWWVGSQYAKQLEQQQRNAEKETEQALELERTRAHNGAAAGSTTTTVRSSSISNVGPTASSSPTDTTGNVSSSSTTNNKYNNTYLDSHYYHVFAQKPRALSPRQHVAHVCGFEYRDVVSCCYEDGQTNNNEIPSGWLNHDGASRMVGEWSAAVDTLPVEKLKEVMDGIATSGMAPHYDRELSQERQDFLRSFVEAQMVVYEAVERGVSNAWFYWTLKVEGGAFAEWDFLRGLEEGWIPSIPARNTSSQSVLGSCYDILKRTNDSMSAVHEYPDPAHYPPNMWRGEDIDDDVVVTHGESLLHPNQYPYHVPHPRIYLVHRHSAVRGMLFLVGFAFVVVVTRFFLLKRRRKYDGYTTIENGINHTSTVVELN